MGRRKNFGTFALFVTNGSQCKVFEIDKFSEILDRFVRILIIFCLRFKIQKSAGL